MTPCQMGAFGPLNHLNTMRRCVYLASPSYPDSALRPPKQIAAQLSKSGRTGRDLEGQLLVAFVISAYLTT